ncbi:MAG: succinate dehydrogenase, cytochrome b556 subunit [Xanthomonadales bacterium]|nr:succinate dehydrogenase, cytochrome b556 subunit [Xanthomonadales bacterium]
MSPYMLGPYYRFQLTSFLSIVSRLTGVFLTVVSTPLVIWWLVALALGPEAFAQAKGFMGSVPGIVLMVFSLFCLCYHFANGIRHLLWDTGRFLELHNVYRSGWIMVAATLVLFVLTWWSAS